MLPPKPKQKEYYGDEELLSDSESGEEGPPDIDNDLLVMRGKRPVKNRQTESIALDYQGRVK